MVGSATHFWKQDGSLFGSHTCVGMVGTSGFGRVGAWPGLHAGKVLGAGVLSGMAAGVDAALPGVGVAVAAVFKHSCNSATAPTKGDQAGIRVSATACGVVASCAAAFWVAEA